MTRHCKRLESLSDRLRLLTSCVLNAAKILASTTSVAPPTIRAILRLDTLRARLVRLDDTAFRRLRQPCLASILRPHRPIIFSRTGRMDGLVKQSNPAESNGIRLSPPFRLYTIVWRKMPPSTLSLWVFSLLYVWYQVENHRSVLITEI